MIPIKWVLLGTAGVEPAAIRLKARCSTTELRTRVASVETTRESVCSLQFKSCFAQQVRRVRGMSLAGVEPAATTL